MKPSTAQVSHDQADSRVPKGGPQPLVNRKRAFAARDGSLKPIMKSLRPKRVPWLITGVLVGAGLGAFFIPGVHALEPVEAFGILCFAAVGLLIGLIIDVTTHAG